MRACLLPGLARVRAVGDEHGRTAAVVTLRPQYLSDRPGTHATLMALRLDYRLHILFAYDQVRPVIAYIGRALYMISKPGEERFQVLLEFEPGHSVNLVDA